MAEQLQPIDLNDQPDLSAVVAEVETTRHARMLQRNGKDVVEVRPARTARRSRKGQPTSADDPIWNIVGMARTDGPSDVAENVDRYLAEAYLDTHE